MKKIKLVCLLLCIVTLLSSTALADSIVPYSDEVFASWSVVLTTTKVAYFSASAYKTYDEIKVSKCVLEQKLDGMWVDKGEVPVPASMKNTTFYSGVYDYVRFIATGYTYRLKVTFWADGYEMTRYSPATDF